MLLICLCKNTLSFFLSFEVLGNQENPCLNVVLCIFLCIRTFKPSERVSGRDMNCMKCSEGLLNILLNTK